MFNSKINYNNIISVGYTTRVDLIGVMSFCFEALPEHLEQL